MGKKLSGFHYEDKIRLVYIIICPYFFNI